MAQNKKNHINYVKEVTKLVRNFFRRDYIKDEVLAEPDDMKKMYHKMNMMAFLMNGIVFNLLSFLTLVGNNMIERGYGILGIAIYLVYFGRGIVASLYNQWDKNLSTEIEFHREDALTICGSKVLGKVTNNVYEKVDHHWKQCSSERITNTVADYLLNSWDVQNNYWINIGQILSTVVMLIATILSNTTIPQGRFIVLLVVTSIITLACSAYDRHHHMMFVAATNPISDEKIAIKNDILRVVPIISTDTQVRIKKYQSLSEKQFSQKKAIIKKDFSSDLVSTVVHIASSYILIILYVISCKTIDLGTVAGMTAALAIFNSAVDSFGQITRVFSKRSQSWDSIEKRDELLREILKVYHQEISIQTTSIDELNIPEFEIGYNEVSENDKPFKLKLKKSLTFKKGDIVVLTGASGTGKSTFLKVATGKIRFRKEKHSSKITPVNYMYYDDSIDFGSGCLFEEMFCSANATPEEICKMEYILKELNLYQEISENCKDFWTWMKENVARSLSRGQKQRMIIAKILYWLTPEIDIVALDEATSGLDAESDDEKNADAKKVLNFIIDYCNRDKKRILFLATHQAISSLCNHNLHFCKNNGITAIQQIY